MAALASGNAFTVTFTKAGALVQPLDVTVTAYVPASPVVADEMLTDEVLLLVEGPVQLNAGDEAPDEAFSTNGSPTHTIVSLAVTVGAAGAPGFVML